MVEHLEAPSSPQAVSVAIRAGIPVSGNTPVSSDLTLIARASEQIKHVRRLAEDISLIATNAMLVARRAGEHAIGFRVVARELRITSDRMAAAMQALTALIHPLVLAVARCRGAIQRTRSLEMAADTGEMARRTIGEALRDSRQRTCLCLSNIRTMTHQLDTAIRRTGRQCDDGIVIARAAAIEAAYGGSMQTLLSQIARNFEASIAELADRIRSLRLQLKAAEA